MIGYIEGSILDYTKNGILLKAGHVGYAVATMTAVRLKSRGTKLSLFTYLAVRETALDLYGFEHTEERAMFELLLTVSGIGPRSAMSVLDSAGVLALKRGIISHDSVLLTKVSGIGKKTAEKIVTELAGTIKNDGLTNPMPDGAHEAIDALISLGYSERIAREAIEKLTDIQHLSIQDIIKKALSSIK